MALNTSNASTGIQILGMPLGEADIFLKNTHAPDCNMTPHKRNKKNKINSSVFQHAAFTASNRTFAKSGSAPVLQVLLHAGTSGSKFMNTYLLFVSTAVAMLPWQQYQQ